LRFLRLPGSAAGLSLRSWAPSPSPAAAPGSAELGSGGPWPLAAAPLSSIAADMAVATAVRRAAAGGLLHGWGSQGARGQHAPAVLARQRRRRSDVCGNMFQPTSRYLDTICSVQEKSVDVRK